MSRAQISLPSKSNALRMPVPVITHTFWPSVDGEGDDMFCLRFCMFPLARRRFQPGKQRARSPAHRYKSPPSATFKKTRSPHTIGVDAEKAGSPSFHAMFSVFDQRIGRVGSTLMAVCEGP